MNMEFDYDSRYKKALQNELSSLIDSNTGNFKPEKVEYLNKCPVCSSKSFNIFCVKDHFIHKRCKKCGLVYLDPKLTREATLAFYNSEVNEIYNEEKFHNINDSAPDNVNNLKNYQILKDKIKDPKGKKFLEIGPGKGTFLKRATDDGYDTYAIELNKILIQNLKKITPNVYSDDIEKIDLPENFFDVIYFRDVMEHIDHPIPFLTKVHKVLKPGGLLLIDTHNINSFTNRRLKEFHVVIFAFEHPVHWSAASLTYAARMVGLKRTGLFMDHSGQTLRHVINSFKNPEFTYINPPADRKLGTFLSLIDKYYYKFRFGPKLDVKLSEFFSKLFRRGSKMQLLFTK